MEAIDEFNDHLVADGHWILACGLGAPSTSVLIDNRGGANILTHGPLVDLPEFVSGFWLIEAPSHDIALGLSRHLMRTTPRTMRTIHQSRQPTRLIPRQPGMNRLTRHPKPSRHLHNRLAIMDNQRHSLITLLHNTQLHNHERKCQASAETTHVKSGSPGARTPNLRIKSPQLYH